VLSVPHLAVYVPVSCVPILIFHRAVYCRTFASMEEPVETKILPGVPKFLSLFAEPLHRVTLPTEAGHKRYHSRSRRLPRSETLQLYTLFSKPLPLVATTRGRNRRVARVLFHWSDRPHHSQQSVPSTT